MDINWQWTSIGHGHQLAMDIDWPRTIGHVLWSISMLHENLIKMIHGHYALEFKRKII